MTTYGTPPIPSNVEALASNLRAMLTASMLGIETTRVGQFVIIGFWDEPAEVTRLIVCCEPKRYEAGKRLALKRAQMVKRELEEKVGGKVDVLASVACTDGRREHV